MNIGIVFKMSTIDSIMRKKSDRHLNVLNHAIELQTLRAELGSVYILCSKKSVRQFKKKKQKNSKKSFIYARHRARWIKTIWFNICGRSLVYTIV